MIKAHGIAHATLTVSNILQTKAFYEELFDTKLIMDDQNSFSLLKVGVPCWFVQWKDNLPNDRFSERRIGLDHIAMRLQTLEELETVVERLKKMGVETKGLQRYDEKYPYVAFRDPDNIQTEFFINEEL